MKTEPLWPTLWNYINENSKRAALREQAIALRAQIVEAAATGRVWSEERTLDTVLEIARSGVSLETVALTKKVRAFLGPIDPEKLVGLTLLGEKEDAIAGSGLYGSFWRSPLGHKARASAGVRIDVLGDPRVGVGVTSDGTPEIDWCPIFDWGHVSSSEPHKEQIRTFCLARFPITVGQYRAFLQSKDGWRNPDWWGSDLYRDPDGDGYNIGRHSNFPVVNVSWFDAVAFCRWLSNRLKFEVRLPTEWEWQRAATDGNDGKIFPWGNDWNPKREPHFANTSESGLQALTAVGMYPFGRSQSGLLDLAGTVWEWCLNKYDRPNLRDSGSKDFEARARRGGSWADDLDGAKCVYRGGYYPGGRGITLGFRVARSAFCGQ